MLAREETSKRIYSKGVRRTYKIIKRKIKVNTSIDKTNCSICADKRSGNKTPSTLIKHKYTYRRKSKYLNSIDRKGERKGLTSKADLISKADDPLPRYITEQ